jgi:hypothetical protein
VSILEFAAAFLLAGTIAYCLLVVIAARHYLAQKSTQRGGVAPISVLKPLSGVDEGPPRI